MSNLSNSIDDRQKALQKLAEAQSCRDKERAHGMADDVLCDLLKALGYEDVVQAYDQISKWYA